MRRKQVTAYIFCVLSLSFNATVAAMTLMELAQADKVRIQTWIEPQENIIARQQVNLQIEIATDKWFSGGTRVGTFEVKDAIVLQREKFAMNSVRQEGNRTWTVQQWTLVVYPQRDGVFEIPAIPVQLSIAGENLEPIVGDLETEPFRFVANLPEPFLEKMSGENLDKTNWIATTRFDVEDSFDKTFDDLKPGDAIVRSIRMSADDLPAMMLPNIAVDKMPGIAVYAKPPQLLDKVNRGIYLAERTQVITYVFEKPGEYQLPMQTFFWWNLETQSLESVELDSQILKVHHLAGVGEGSIQAQSPAAQSNLSQLFSLSIKAGIAFLLVIVAGVVIRKLSRKPAHARPTQPARLSESALRKQFNAACRKNNLHSAIGLFYQWLDNYGGKAFKGSVREQLIEINQLQLTTAFRNIMRSIYTPDQNNEVDLKLFADQFISELKKPERPNGFYRLRVELKLN